MKMKKAKFLYVSVFVSLLFSVSDLIAMAGAEPPAGDGLRRSERLKEKGEGGGPTAIFGRKIRGKRERHSPSGLAELSLYKEFCFDPAVLRRFKHATALIKVPVGMRPDLIARCIAGKRVIQRVTLATLGRVGPSRKKLYIFDDTLEGRYDGAEVVSESDDDLDDEEDSDYSSPGARVRPKISVSIGSLFGGGSDDEDPKFAQLARCIHNLEHKSYVKDKKPLLALLVVARRNSCLVGKISECFPVQYDVPHMSSEKARSLLERYTRSVTSARRTRSRSSSRKSAPIEWVRGMGMFGFGGIIFKAQRGKSLEFVKERFAALKYREEFLDYGEIVNVVKTRKPSVSFEKDVASEIVPDKLKKIMRALKGAERLADKASYVLPEMTFLLLHGPSGTGKSFISEAMAKELGVAQFVFAPAGSLVSEYSGETAVKIRKLFQRTASNLLPGQKAFIFLDEVDGLASKRSSRSDSASKDFNLNVTTLLTELDMINKNRHKKKIILIMATNRKDDIDGAFLRRIPYKIKMDLPTVRGRRAVLEKRWRHYVPDLRIPMPDFRGLALKTERFSCGDLDTILQNARIEAAASGSEHILEKHIDAAFEGIKKERMLPESIRRIYV